MSLTMLGSGGSWELSAQEAQSSRRPARLLVPQDARPLPNQDDSGILSGAELDLDLSPAGPSSPPLDEAPAARSRPAVVRLTLLDDGPGETPARQRSARYHDTEETSRQPARTVHPVGYQDRAWTRRSETSRDELRRDELRRDDVRVAREDVRRAGTTTGHFDDPFGDRPATTRPMVLAPSRGSYQDPRDSRDDYYPSPAQLNRTQGASPARRSSSDCERIYNDRNCCDDEAVCQQARQRILRSPISAISLDISPRFNPTSQDTGRLPDRERTFEDETRTWRDRSGRQVAQGSLVGIEHGRVLIRLASGAIERVPLRQLSDDDICYFAAWWGVPNVCTLTDEMYADRQFAPLTMSWKASALCHKPLYFEEVQLERYGHTTGPIVQPVLSGAHFVLNIAALPYRAGINPPTECQYSLGYYRPGNCAPWMVPPIPLSVRGGLAQAGAVVGGVAIFP